MNLSSFHKSIKDILRKPEEVENPEKRVKKSVGKKTEGIKKDKEEERNIEVMVARRMKRLHDVEPSRNL